MNRPFQVPIGNLVSKVTKWNPPKDAPKSILQYIDIASIDRKQKKIIGTKAYYGSESPSRARQLVCAGDILVSTVRPNLNAVAEVPISLDGATASTGYCVLRANKSELSQRYLHHWVQTPTFVNTMVSRATGASYPAVTDKIIKASKIPLPSLPEQRRIATILDKADELRAKRRAALNKLDTLLKSIFIDMFGDPVRNPKGWAVGTIGDIAAQVNYGTSQKAGAKGKYPILRMGNITYEGNWDFSSMKYIDLDGKELSKYLVHQGQVLFNRTNSKKLVGKTAVYREIEPMAFAGYLIRVIPNHKADPEYLAGFMNSAYAKTYLREKCKSIVGMANINARELQAIKLPIPPIALQNQYGKIIKKVEQERKRQIKNLAVIDNLFNALQQRAFRGELTNK